MLKVSQSWWQRQLKRLRVGPRAGARGQLYRPRVELLEDRQLLTTILVTNTNDTGDGSLRNAILAANSTIEADVITFNIGTGAKLIMPNALPAISRPVVIDATSQIGFVGTPLITLDGGNGGANAYGLDIQSSDVTVRGLIFTNWQKAAIHLKTTAESANCRIELNYIGTDVANATNKGNKVGIEIDESNGNTLGGDVVVAASNGLSYEARNVISSNTEQGILIKKGKNNRIYNNYIGTKIDGEAPLGNHREGIRLDSIASGTVTGNLIGVLAATGQQTTARSNVISGNWVDGIRLLGVGVSGNEVSGNFIGTDRTGQNVGTFPSMTGNVERGISILNGASNNKIGRAVDVDAHGVIVEPANVISGNGIQGILLMGDLVTELFPAGNTIEGNFIGINRDGIRKAANNGELMGNHWGGIAIRDVHAKNTIGSMDAQTLNKARNVISANRGPGIQVENSTDIDIFANNIGTNKTGDRQPVVPAPTLNLGNDGPGILLKNATNTKIKESKIGFNKNPGVKMMEGSKNNVIKDPNYIFLNEGPGVLLTDPGTDYNIVADNFIGTDESGQDLGNGGPGVLITNYASYNTVGGNSSTDGNTIAYNDGAGIRVESGSDNLASLNTITANAGGGIHLPDGSTADTFQISQNVLDSLLVEDGSAEVVGLSPVTLVSLSGGNITGPSVLEVLGSMSWTDGTQTGSGRTDIKYPATLLMNSSATLALQRLLHNYGAAGWLGSGRIAIDEAAAFVNQPSGAFDASATGTFGTDDSTGAFINRGAYTQSGVMAPPSFAGLLPFSNSGTVGFGPAARLILQGPYAQTAGSTFVSFAGEMLVTESVTQSGGTINIGSETGTFDVAKDFTLSGGALLVGDGVLRVADDFLQSGGGTTLAGTTVAGTIEVADTFTLTDGTFTALLLGLLDVEQSVTLSGGQVHLDDLGALRFGTGLFIQSGGRLSGSGTLVGDVFNAGLIEVGRDSTTTSDIYIVGNYTQSSTGVLQFELDGANATGQLYVSGLATLAGTLRLSTGLGSPSAPMSLTLVHYGSRSGTFAALDLPSLSYGIWDPRYDDPENTFTLWALETGA